MNLEERAQSDDIFMVEALRQAQRAYQRGEVPVGAIVVRAGKVIARAYNQVELLKDATAHAEMLALTMAESVVGDWRLTDCTLVVTLEPCTMCAGAGNLPDFRMFARSCACSAVNAPEISVLAFAISLSTRGQE